MKRRFFCQPGAIRNNRAALHGQLAAHIVTVLRMNPGDRLTLCDGKEREWDGVIRNASREEVKVEITAERTISPHPPPRVTLCVALMKASRFDWLVEKATELGVDSLVPMRTSRTAVRSLDSGEARTERWNRIAVMAAEQCGRNTLPIIFPVHPFEKALARVGENDRAFIFIPGSGLLRNLLPRTPPEQLGGLIGPEGGFSPEESAMSIEAGCVPASLGSLTLRSETAPLAALSILRHFYPW